MSLKGKILILAGLLGASGYAGSPFIKPRSPEIPHYKDRNRVVPKGCQIFYFDADGHFSTQKSWGSNNIEIVALNPRNAVRKFNNLMKAKIE